MRSLGNIKATSGTTKFFSVLDDGKVVAAYVELTSKPVSYTHLDVYKRQTVY